MASLGHLHVSVVEGRKLCLELDARPSVHLQLGIQEARTPPLHDLNDCKWVSEFRFQVFSAEASLTVTLLDDARNSHPVGKASLSVRDMIPGGTHVRWLTMKDVYGEDVGQICLVSRFLQKPLPGNNGVKEENHVSSPSTSPSLSPRQESLNGAQDNNNNNNNNKKYVKKKDSGGKGRYLAVVAGAAVTLLLSAFAWKNRHHLKRKSKYHEVKHGETLCSIADSYGLSPDDVFEANMSVTSDPDRIFPGDRIYIP